MFTSSATQVADDFTAVERYWKEMLVTIGLKGRKTDREDLILRVLVRGRVVKRVGGDVGWDIVDRIFTKYTGGPYPSREDREAFLVEPEHVSVPAFG